MAGAPDRSIFGDAHGNGPVAVGSDALLPPERTAMAIAAPDPTATTVTAAMAAKAEIVPRSPIPAIRHTAMLKA